jgi:large subunit ribosomal protein L24
MLARVKKGDTVFVISGKDKGRTGKVLQVFPKQAQCIVEKISVVKRHQKAKPGQPAGIVEKSLPIHLSKVMPVDVASNKHGRVRSHLQGGKKERKIVSAK